MLLKLFYILLAVPGLVAAVAIAAMFVGLAYNILSDSMLVEDLKYWRERRKERKEGNGDGEEV